MVEEHLVPPVTLSVLNHTINFTLEFPLTNKAFWARKIRSAITAADAGPSEINLAEAPMLTYWRPHIFRNGAPIIASEEFVFLSADFGRTYLSEGWATQFMRALIERFVVVFVGYTADDPPMRYLLEALNTRPGSRSRLYAFQSGTDQNTLAMWEHCGVQAISFDTSNDYAALWDTLAAWAERARDHDAWHNRLLQEATQGPDKMSAYVRGQIAHLISTPEGSRRIGAADHRYQRHGCSLRIPCNATKHQRLEKATLKMAQRLILS